MAATSSRGKSGRGGKGSKSETREQLLAVAGEVFSAQGYQGASVREICRQAEANIASVSYYFGGKKGLYQEVVAGTHATTLAAKPMPRFHGQGDARAALRAWIRWFHDYLLDETSKPPWFSRLILREIADPSSALDETVERSIRPVFEELAGLVGRLGEGVLEPRDIREAARTIIGACVVRAQSRAIFERLDGQAEMDAAAIGAISEHAWTFIIGGLDALIAARGDAP